MLGSFTNATLCDGGNSDKTGSIVALRQFDRESLPIEEGDIHLGDISSRIEVDMWLI